MNNINIEIGSKIRFFRKQQQWTVQQLANAIHKSKATTSKYECGAITVDIVTLYEIAAALNVRIEQLLCRQEQNLPKPDPASKYEEMGSVRGTATFFTGLSQFYSYVFDGRTNRIMHCVFDVGSKIQPQKYNIMMYMNFLDFNTYQDCETTYFGTIEHFDVITNILLTNQESPMESAIAQILAPYASARTKWGLFQALSSRPLMPVSTKMLFAKKPLKEDAALQKKLTLSRDDIRTMKHYNMLGITG